MADTDILSNLAHELHKMQAKGENSVQIHSLLQFIRDTRPVGIPRDFKLAEYDAQLKASLATLQASHNGQLESFRAVIQFGIAALRAAVLVNAGACVALLSFMGALATSGRGLHVIPSLGSALSVFLWAVIASTVASGVSYLSQRAYAEWNRTLGHWMFGLALAAILSSYALFIFGSIMGRNALEMLANENATIAVKWIEQSEAHSRTANLQEHIICRD